MTDIHKERIRKIADEAGEWCSKNSDGAWGMLEWECKFAELLVRECMDQCEDMDDRYRIGIHFGV